MSSGSAADGVIFPGTEPGKATASLNGGQLTLSNNVLAVTWDLRENGPRLVEMVDRLAGAVLSSADSPLVTVETGAGQVFGGDDFRLRGDAQLERLESDTEALRRADRFAGWRARVPLIASRADVRVAWLATLRDSANYVTLELIADRDRESTELRRVTLLDFAAEGARAAGSVDGSPIVSGGWFAACEHPMAKNQVVNGRVQCSIDHLPPPSAGGRGRSTAVIGVVPPGQLRRGFLYYVERERPRPYAVFVHYNSWWDIAWGDRKMSEQECLDVIRGFGDSLTKQREVHLDSFCFDDGWDDNRTLWRFHDGFPQGFRPLQAAAASYDSALGVWLSPWGGYGQAKAERMQYGQSQGFETNSRGFSLTGPKYFQRFRDVCFEMIHKYGCNYFKFDGIAQGVSSTGAGDEFASDVAALLQLVDDLRSQRPDVFVNITTGTWPSPYWLWHGDSIWRNGADVGFHGAGSVRQQSITYRDMFTRRMIVGRAPLYPLNSLMICSVVYAQRGTAQKMEDDVDDLTDEIRMAYAGGTQCLELYMTPGMMKSAGWDALAEATRWARANQDTLVDTHWIGGDPGAAEPYGYAAWSPSKGILTLRNPAGDAASITLNLAEAFELPPGSANRYRLSSPWRDEADHPPLELQSGVNHTFQLGPLQCLVLEAKLVR